MHLGIHLKHILGAGNRVRSCQHTFGVVVGGGDEDEVAGLHVLLALHAHRQRVIHVALVPRPDPEAEVFPQVAKHSSDQAAAVQEYGLRVFGL